MPTSPLLTYVARGIQTQWADCPSATAVTIDPRTGKIVWVGEPADAPSGTRVDDRFADAVLLPGFVEAHTHPDTGWLWGAGIYVGVMDRVDTDGVNHPGCRTHDAVLARLAQAESRLTDARQPLLAWGFDPLLVLAPGDAEQAGALDRRMLDAISATRPIFVFHASQHVASVNSTIIDGDSLSERAVLGIERDPNGVPTGVLVEPEAILTTSIARQAVGAFDPSGLHAFAREAARAGCTTVTDLDSLPLATPDGLAAYNAAVTSAGFPVRINAFSHIDPSSGESLAQSIVALQRAEAQGNAMLRTGFAKLFLDGSIQARTARVTKPYLGGNEAERGVWLTDPARFRDAFAALARVGASVHVHGNGDAAAELFAETLCDMRSDPAVRGSARHVLTHAQLAPPDALSRIRDAGGSVSFLINHVRWWGDAEADRILGTARAAHLDPAGTAARLGVPFSLHSDSPVTPLEPLELIANAIDRCTSSGMVLGANERITAAQAVAAVTRTPAWQLGMEHEIGVLRPGLRADMVALSADPTMATDGDSVRAIDVQGTLLDGLPVDLASER